MEIQEIIKKYDMSLVVRDGQEMIRVGKPPRSEKIAKELKAAKPEILAELKVMEAEKAAARAARMAEIEARVEKEKTEYLATADLRRCLVEYQDEWGHVDHYIETLHFPADEDRVYRAQYQLGDHVSLKHVTGTMKAVANQGQGAEYGLGGAAWEITPEEEAQIMTEQVPAAEEAARIATEEQAQKEAAEAEEKARKEAELAGKFAQAKETGTPVIIRTYMVPCSDPREECDADHVVEYAMPDGTTKREQHHTW